MNDNFIKDYRCFTPSKFSKMTCFLRLIKNYELRFLYCLRAYQNHTGGVWRILLNHYRKKYGIEILCKDIGPGLHLIHPWGITVNACSRIGENCTLFKGVTIGEIKYGSRNGFPTIGNNCILYANSTVCGNIHVGNDCIIAAGAFVNFDVPDNAIVIGNPGRIYQKRV